MFDRRIKGWLIKFVEENDGAIVEVLKVDALEVENDRAIVEMLEVNVPEVEEAIVEFPKVYSDTMKAFISDNRKAQRENFEEDEGEDERVREKRIERKLVFLIDNENIPCMRYFY